MAPWPHSASAFSSQTCLEGDLETMCLQAPEALDPVPNELEHCWVHEIHQLRANLTEDFRSVFQECHKEYKLLLQQQDCLLQRFAEHLASCTTISQNHDSAMAAAAAARARRSCMARPTLSCRPQQQQQQQNHVQQQPPQPSQHLPTVEKVVEESVNRWSAITEAQFAQDDDGWTSPNADSNEKANGTTSTADTDKLNVGDWNNTSESDTVEDVNMHNKRMAKPIPLRRPANKASTKGVFDFAPRLDKTSLAEEEYNVCDLYKDTGWSQWLIKHDGFAKLSFVIILANAAFIGIDLDTNTADTLIDSDWYYQVCEHVFCFFFTGELLLRFFAFRVKRHCLLDFWFRFDSALVLMMVIETWIIPACMLTVGFPTLPKGPNKLLRLFRLARMTRLAKALPELIIMMKGMQTAARAVLSSMMMLALLIYVFSAVMYTFLSNEPELERHFGSLLRCMWTLLMDGTFLDSTGELLTRMIDMGYNGMVWCFLMFILLSALLVMNMLIGVLCEVVSTTAQAEKDANAISLVKQSLLTLFKEFDADNSGTITLEELDGVMGCGESLRVFEDLNINVEYFLQYAQMLFEDPSTEMAIEDIMELVLKMRGDTPTKAEDIIQSNMFTHWKIQQIMYDMMEEYSATVVRGLPQALNSLRSLGDCTGQPSVQCGAPDPKTSCESSP